MLRKPLAALLMIVAARSPAFAETQRTVHFHTTDDVTITGTYYPVKRNPAPAVLLIHSVARNRTTWEAFAKLLQQGGMAALAIDLRGHGESTGKLTADGSLTIDFHNFAGSDYQDMLLDIEAAVDWLQVQPEIDRKHIALAGESLGANLVLRYAAINEDIAALVVFSPGINYRGVRTDDVILQVGRRPLHIFVSQFDAFAFESSKRLVEIQIESGIDTATNELTICTGNLHGSNMLLGVKNLPQIAVKWLKEAFTQGAAPSATAAPTAPSRDTTHPPK
ncbi:MAG: alpha/beta fold hydrolase [Verrucomicrobiia bacterium]